jgi:ATP-dependent DNA helicase RecG
MELDFTRIPADGARMRARAFWRFAGRLEHEQLEFKRSPAALKEAIPAMAMSRGGVVVIGVTDERRLVGHSLDQDTLDRVAAAAYEAGVDVDVREIAVGGRPLTLVVVPAVPDRVVTTPDGRLLRRVGSANQPLRGDALTRFVLARALR